MKFAWVLIFVLHCLVGIEGAIIMGDQGPAVGLLTKNVIIPCSFEVSPLKEIDNATVIWWKERAYSGPLVYLCAKMTSSTGNCTKSTGRYSFGGNLVKRNVSLRISNVTHQDAGSYFCRIQLEEQINWFTSNAIELRVKEPQELRRIYIQTTVTGEHWVTCEVSGDPPPNVNWIQPKNISTPQISIRIGSLASYSLPASYNTNYTCQMNGEDEQVAQSIYLQQSVQCVCQYHTYLDLIAGLGAMLGLVLILNVLGLVTWCCRATATKPSENPENIYHNFPRPPDLDGIYMNARKKSPNSK